MLDLLIQGVLTGIRHLQQDAEIQKAVGTEQKIAAITAVLEQIRQHDQEQSKAIGALYDELQGLTPHNLTPRIEDLYKWVNRLAQSERERAKKQLYWNAALAIGLGAAFVLAVMSLAFAR